MRRFGQLLLTTRSLPNSSAEVLGWLALAFTLAIWSCFALSIRWLGTSPLTPTDAALCRFLPPALLLLPFVPRCLGSLFNARFLPAAMVSIGAGLPFFLLAAVGGRLSSAAYVGTLIAGTTPLAIVGLKAILRREYPQTRQLPGLGAIGVGVAILTLGSEPKGGLLLAGIGTLLLASVLWSGYSLAVKDLDLDPIGYLTLITYPSAALLIGLIACGLIDSRLAEFASGRMLPLIFIQGVAVGIGSNFAYAVAIRKLGVLRCAMVGSLSPVITTLLAIPILGESPSLVALAGTLVVSGGVLYSNAKGVR